MQQMSGNDVQIIAYIISVIVVFLIGVKHNWWYNKKEKWVMPKIKDGVPTKWGWVVRHPENLTLGENTDIGFGTYIQAEHGVEIGKNVQIGSHCAIYSTNTIDQTHSKIIICEGVKIGSGTIILPKHQTTNEALVIGRYSKIGALSLVKDDIYEGDIVAGIPAKSIIRR